MATVTLQAPIANRARVTGLVTGAAYNVGKQGQVTVDSTDVDGLLAEGYSRVEAIGFGTGVGGAVTQATSRTTGVTLSKVCGQITTHNASLAAAAKAAFVVTNTKVAAADVVVATITSGGTGTPRVDVIGVAAGSFTLQITNDHAATADTSADIINFAVLKGVAA